MIDLSIVYWETVSPKAIWRSGFKIVWRIIWLFECQLDIFKAQMLPDLNDAWHTQDFFFSDRGVANKFKDVLNYPSSSAFAFCRRPFYYFIFFLQSYKPTTKTTDGRHEAQFPDAPKPVLYFCDFFFAMLHHHISYNLKSHCVNEWTEIKFGVWSVVQCYNTNVVSGSMI